jgi:hypothetical protein
LTEKLLRISPEQTARPRRVRWAGRRPLIEKELKVRTWRTSEERWNNYRPRPSIWKNKEWSLRRKQAHGSSKENSSRK